MASPREPRPSAKPEAVTTRVEGGSAADASLVHAAQAEVTAGIDRLFDRLLAVPSDPRGPLYEAMRHAAIGGGKRLRPLLVRAAGDLYHVDQAPALRVGAAVEAMHVYSLIHDDLPCMDDDDMRRGKPTVHKAFGEATAILAGDSLHALAFEWLVDPATHADPFVRGELVRELARAAGPAGMAGGQMMDLAAETADFDLPTVTRLQQLKTGALIAFSVEAGAVLARIPAEGRTPLRGYARDIGLAFQIADDIMDVEGDEALAGKALHKDDAAGKATFVTLMGIERAREQAALLVDQAIAHLSGFGDEAALLRAIARYVVERDR
ncbi:farnesyl-diphosphate synthase [Sphingopyxis flava]|uniref:Farnesyl-diphosphate synthase n=1 Tax=Sphingopyxis flava TaxID=1507287 RepID=A0A1T5DGP2_9SPHN|nr:farnesyl-diphosphate synthase [Sphingopyxis flava]